MEDIYFSGDVESNEETDFYKYLYPLIKINDIPRVKPVKIPYRLILLLSQLLDIVSLDNLYEKAKSIIKDNQFEMSIPLNKFENLLKRTLNWVKEVEKIVENEPNYKIKKSILNKVSIFSIPKSLDKRIIEGLNENQVKGILKLREYLFENTDASEEEIQNKIFNIAKEIINIPPKKMFEAIYQVILGKKFGPRLGPFLVLLDREWLLARLDIEKLL
jgi:lysyl-tRNA synthetase class 1